MILDKITEKRKIQLDKEMTITSFENIKKAANACSRNSISFKNALSSNEHLAVISEVKKASPSKGIIQENFNPVEIAMLYEQHGADAVSCLTEEFYFQGSAEYFRNIRAKINIPMLRKDFVIDPYQIYEAKILGADAILLIAAILDDAQLAEYKNIADYLGLDVLAEVHDIAELNRILSMDFDVIGVNNRNLKDFNVSLNTTAEIAKLIPQNKVIVSESGIKDNYDMVTVKKHGADAVLVGETLMRSADIGYSLAELRAGT